MSRVSVNDGIAALKKFVILEEIGSDKTKSERVKQDESEIGFLNGLLSFGNDGRECRVNHLIRQGGNYGDILQRSF